MTTPKSIIIIGRRWFEKTTGNTYHTTRIYLDCEEIGTTEIQYGYGDQYLWTAFEWLEENGHIARNTPGGRTEPPWVYCERVGCKLSYSLTEVGRRKDL